jgi:MoaA/NifB/PqqE/SkfB family radical SAM enzyme
MFHFYGGEPTLHPDLRTYMRILKDVFGENIRIKLSTNLEREMEYFDDLPDYVEVWASYHHFSPDWHKKVMMLQNRKMLKKALLMCDVTNYDTIYEIVKILKPKIDCIKISPIDKFRRSSKYSYFKGEKGFEDHDPYEDYEILDIVVDGEKYNKVPNVEDFNNFEGYLCNAGFDIYPDGAVKYCSRDDRVLLNLINEEPKKLERLHVCRSKDCPCDPEFGKYSMKYYLREILKK